MQDWHKNRQFAKLNKQNNAIDVKVLRDGTEQLLPNTQVLVGDVLLLEAGDKVVADGVYLHGYDLVIDESSLTGESEPIKKGSDDPWCRRYTTNVWCWCSCVADAPHGDAVERMLLFIVWHHILFVCVPTQPTRAVARACQRAVAGCWCWRWGHTVSGAAHWHWWSRSLRTPRCRTSCGRWPRSLPSLAS